MKMNTMNNLNRNDALIRCCAECGVDEGVASLKVCKSCMFARYCNADCQRNHWPTHKQECKRRAAELRDKALFKDPPPKEDCPICFLPMPISAFASISLPSATILSVPIDDFVEGLPGKAMEAYYPCCGKSICVGCIHSFGTSGNTEKCAFCNSVRGSKSHEEQVKDLMKRVEANDAGAICLLGSYYYHGLRGYQQDRERAKELLTRSVELGSSKAHGHLGELYEEGGDLKKAKFHREEAAMAGHETARCIIGSKEYESGNVERAVKHWMIAASAGEYKAMKAVLRCFEEGICSRDQIDSTLIAYNDSCAEMRSEARDSFIRMYMINN